GSFAWAREPRPAILASRTSPKRYSTAASDSTTSAAWRTLRRLAQSQNGWPALYLAATRGCEIVACDVPVEGLTVGVRRAHADGLDPRVRFVAARRDALQSARLR